jgi:transposase
VTKAGKTHTYWRLVRSVRCGSKVRQETVAHLGELDAAGRARASELARHFLGKPSQQLELFEDDSHVAPQQVHLDRVRVERVRDFGDVWLAWTLWTALGLDSFCERTIPEGREQVPWPQIAAVLVIARLCEPSSELHIAEDWYRRTALEEILGVRPEQVHHTRLYQGLDRLLAHKAEIEVHLKNRIGELFALDYDLLLYDVTSTYFEGHTQDTELVKRGYSRDHRPDCRQVCIGLVVTRDGFPLGYEIFAGNRTDVTTVEKIVETMESRHGQVNRIWVMDRGMMSEANLQWLREGGRRYVLGTSRSEMKRWEHDLVAKEGWNQVREGLEVKLCPGPDGSETFVLCRSADRERKESAMHERFANRIKTGLTSLSNRLAKARRPADRAQVERQIGRLLERNSRAGGKFSIRVESDGSAASGLRLDWSENAAWTEWAKRIEGTYVLRSNVNEWSAEELWRTYVQLCEAEAAFRIQKSDLNIRPVWHHRDDRIEAHILVCFIAYALWKTLQGWQRRAGLGDSPKTILEELRRIPVVNVVLPLEGDSEMTLRCVAQPDRSQAQLLDRLGIQLPRRLRMPALTAKT